MKILPVVLALALAVSAHGDTISGDVFIVTHGKAAIKMPLARVLLYKKEEAKAALSKRAEQAEFVAKFLIEARDSKLSTDAIFPDPQPSRFSLREELAAYADYIVSSDWFISGLLDGGEPKPIASTKTDAEGKFSFDVPGGEYVAFSFSSRFVGGQTEIYTWLVLVKTGVIDLHLANDNLCGSGARESLLDLKRADGKTVLVMDGRSPEWLIDYARKRRAAMHAAEDDEESRRYDALRRLSGGNVAITQKAAIQEHPSLAVAGSPLNKAFTERHKKIQVENPDFLKDPAWPMILADQCAEELAKPPTP